MSEDKDMYTVGKPMSKLQSLISQSTLIHQGPPPTFLLNTGKKILDDSGKIRKRTFGEKNQSRTRTILMMGETGTGKSSLINVMVNYILGVEYNDNFRFEIIKEAKRSQTESQTTAITVYEIYGYEGVRVPFSLRLIDTPGYLDTQVEKHDKQIAKNISKLFHAERGIQQIDAVCLVVKASENRPTDTQHFIFDAFLSLFGKDIKNNIIALLTFSDGGPSNALEAIDKACVPCARDLTNKPIFFRFNNVQKKKGGDVYDDDYDDYDDFVQRNWNLGVKTVVKFFESLNKMETRSLQMTREVLMGRQQLEMNIQRLKDQITEMENLDNMHKQTQDALEKHKEDIDTNKDFNYEVDEPFTNRVDTKCGYPATSCKECKTNCHYPCTVVHPSQLQMCDVMKRGSCTVCEKKCSFNAHNKENKIYMQSTRQVTKTFEILKNQYETASGEKTTAENRIKNIQEALSDVVSDKRKLIEDSYQHILSLFNIALQPDSSPTLQHLDLLLERLKEIGTAEPNQKIKDLKIRVKEICKLKHLQ